MSHRTVEIVVRLRLDTSGGDNQREDERAADRLERDVERAASGRDYERLEPEVRVERR